MTNLLPKRSVNSPTSILFHIVFVLAILTGAATAQESRGIKNLKDADLDLMNNHDPASQLENFDLLPGYQANLFAADPMFANPVHMHWDSKGRLWVACSWAYPQLKPGEVANDKIIILEDTDNDGVADKSTVFAEGLYLPTGIELANGGCYVAQSPDIFFLKDTDARTFLLASGKVQTGIVTFRNEKEVVVRDSAQLGKEVRLDVDDIEDDIPAKSLMPAGLADQLHSRGEFLDLVKFISVLGKPGEYANDESPVIRKWRVISASADGGLPDDDAAWQPAYSKVSGELPAEDYPAGEQVFVRGFVNVLVAGAARLDVNTIDGLTLWIDGKRVDDFAALIRLDRGRRTLTLGFRKEQRKSGLRVELKAMDDKVRFQPDGGL